MEKNIDFYDIYDYYQLPIYKTFWFKSIAVIFFLLISILLIVLIYKKIYKKKLTVWQKALKELNNLSLNLLSKCEKKEDFKKFYFVLTEIIKNYLQMRYSWQTKDKTDEELIEYLKNKNFDSGLVLDLQKLKENALWVKFADENVLKAQAEKDLTLAIDLISKTIPKE